MAEYFCEILLEEIPAWMIDDRLTMLREKLGSFVEGYSGVTPGSDDVVVGATSRRIWFVLRNLPERQADRAEEVKGPPVAAAYRDGAPTQALEGFLRRNAITAAQVEQREGYVYARRTVRGEAVGDALTASIPEIVRSIRWPKMMRWGKGEMSYIRPAHSIVSLLDGAHLPISLLGIESGTTTKGHRTLHAGVIDAGSFAEYRARLAEAHVTIDAADRVESMRKLASTLASEVDGQPARDESIWDQWKYLTECPGLIRAEFRKENLELPEEVLVTVMRVHQKQLPVVRDGKLTSSFLAIVDHVGDPEGNASSGNAFVTNARFDDARFFYETDRRRALESRLPDLEHLQFQEKLGDYRAKTDRIVRLAAELRNASGSKTEEEQVRRAATLAKCDLVTEMVKEFTDLQGKVGGIYAREEGAPEPVWQAIYDHYLPLSADGQMPRSETAAIVALADKLDTLAGFFSIGLRPSGSRDPFALRRAAQGAVQILLNRAGWTVAISPRKAVELATAGYDAVDQNGIVTQLLAFLEERVRTLLENAPFSFSYDEIDAVLAAGWDSAPLHDVHDRAIAVASARENPQFLQILDSAKRIANITRESDARSVDPSKLEHPAEQRLHSLVQITGDQVDDLIGERNFSAALDSFAGLASELEQFFNDVMVNVDDVSLRENRKALLRMAGTLVGRVADVTRIVVDRRELRENR